MIRRSLIIVFSSILLTLFGGMDNCVCAQVLTPPEKENLEARKAIAFDGMVDSSKKYSFVVSSANQTYQVELAPTAEIVLRLNKPNFDFSQREVKVQRTVIRKSENLGEDLRPGRISYRLPETLFVKASFETERQMQRIMQAAVKRINNYQMSPADFGSQMPTEKSKQISGQVVADEASGGAKLVIDKEEFSVMFGHRGGELGGFTILDLKPKTTEVFVTGSIGSDNTVIAERIEFRPVVSVEELSKAKTAENGQQ